MIRLVQQFSGAKENPFKRLIKSHGGANYFAVKDFQDPKVINRLPFSIRILLENALRNCDQFQVKSADVHTIYDWEKHSKSQKEIPFKPGRVILQDFTGVPAVVDLAAMRDAMVRLGGDAKKINPLCPVDLVIDHSVQVDVTRTPDAYKINQRKQFDRNKERFEFLKWGSTAFNNFKIVPPGSGIVHQVNLQYLAQVVLKDEKGFLLPDSLVGTDSHTTMINGLGVMGWGVGGIEAQAVMLGQPISMVLPQVIGFKLTGKLKSHVTSTDLVLTIVQMLRKKKVVGKFVQFYGEGCDNITLADRATIANMAPQYGATMGFFPFDNISLDYLKKSGRPSSLIERTKVLDSQGLFRTSKEDIKFTDSLELNLDSVQPSLSGPKRPHDRVPLKDMKSDFTKCISSPLGFKGFGLAPQAAKTQVAFKFQGKDYKLRNGTVCIAAVTSCTNTSNPDVMVAAGLVAKKAAQKGLTVAPYIKTSLSPGSGVVTKYLDKAGLTPHLNKLGFTTAGYGCMTCIGNSGQLDTQLVNALKSSELVGAAVLSGNRNFQARIHPNIKANYLASPPLVVAYALAGRVDIDFQKQPIAKESNGKQVFLKDIWPSREQIREVLEKATDTKQYEQFYSKVTQGSDLWKSLKTTQSVQYKWNQSSTYIHNPPFFQTTELTPKALTAIQNARCLAYFGDSITTDHISPAGNIAKKSPAAKHLQSKGVQPQDYNTYGARRGNDEIMSRGTFANTRIINKLVKDVGPHTLYFEGDKQQKMFISEAAFKYLSSKDKTPVIVIAGQEYGSGSSRDWAAKGPALLGVRAVIAQSFQRIHRSNLAGMGILPLQFLAGQSGQSLGLTGKQSFTIKLDDLAVHKQLQVSTNNGKKFKAKCRLDTDVQIQYFKHGGILQYVLRKLLAK